MTILINNLNWVIGCILIGCNRSVDEKELGYLDYVALPDSTKLSLIGQLLGFVKDTDLSCRKVTSYSFNGIEGCRGNPNGVDRYSIAIEALFTINRFCWPKSMELYSCTPVLWDTARKIAINDNPRAIAKFAKEYKKWYKQCVRLGYIPKKFPFNKGKYVWFGGRKDEPYTGKGIFD